MDLEQGTLYDPPIPRSTSRGRSASFSAPSQPRSSLSQPRRQSTLGGPTTPVPVSQFQSDSDDSQLSDNGEDGDDLAPREPLLQRSASTATTLVNLNDDEDGGPHGFAQNPLDAAQDLKTQRPSRMSAGWEKKGTIHSADMADTLAQLYDLTHAIDALENDIDDIVALRNKITHIKPKDDIGSASITADLNSQQNLVSETGKKIIALENWLTALHEKANTARAEIKAGRASFTMAELGEVKFEVASAKMDFADAMERIREGAWKEEEKRERTRIWMAKHIRSREVDIEDRDIRKLLKAAELGAADGVINNPVTSYSGLWALTNPFTELAELTNGMSYLGDDLDKEIVDQVVGKSKSKRTINKDAKSSSKSSKSSSKASSKPLKAARPKKVASPWYGSRLSYYSRPLQPRDDKFGYLKDELDHAEKDLDYGNARLKQLETAENRKRVIIALLVIIIFGLILLVWFATMRTPDSILNATPATTTSRAPQANEAQHTATHSSFSFQAQPNSVNASPTTGFTLPTTTDSLNISQPTSTSIEYNQFQSFDSQSSTGTSSSVATLQVAASIAAAQVTGQVGSVVEGVASSLPRRRHSGRWA